MLIIYRKIVLGQHINTRTMLVSTPHPFLNEVLDMLKYWHAGRKSFSLPEIEPLIGKLNHVAQTNRWMSSH
jgi:hypothetical protein